MIPPPGEFERKILQLQASSPVVKEKRHSFQILGAYYQRQDSGSDPDEYISLALAKELENLATD